MTDNVDYLPIWKEGATASERLSELSMMARKHPEWFCGLAVIYEEKTVGGDSKVRYSSLGFNTNELLGVLYRTKLEVVDYAEE